MNVYIILTGSIYDMGGAEMFTSNKCTYLKEKGWNVQVFFFNKGHEIIIDNLKEYENNYIPELKYGYYYWSRKQRERILDKLCLNISADDYIVVESHLMNLTYWGELIAQRTGAKSILNCMEEYIRQLTPAEAAFVEYKVKRNEVLNGSSRSYQRYFGNLYKKEYDLFSNTMIPLCSNVVSEDDNKEFNLPDADYNLMSIGRLDKPYIQTMLMGVKQFVDNYPQYRYNFLIIGGSPDGMIEQQIQEIFASNTNVNICMYGYLFPIPLGLIKKADVSMASANSVLVTADQGVPTIVYDMCDYQTVGVFGYTTENCFKRQHEPIVPTEILLKKVLFDEKYPKKSVIQSELNILDKVFDPQIEFLSKSPNDGKAYDVMTIHSKFEYYVANIKRILLTLSGRW